VRTFVCDVLIGERDGVRFYRTVLLFAVSRALPQIKHQVWARPALPPQLRQGKFEWKVTSLDQNGV
jgi:hypothetical protein